jgi:hypothetical protein
MNASFPLVSNSLYSPLGGGGGGGLYRRRQWLEMSCFTFQMEAQLQNLQFLLAINCIEYNRTSVSDPRVLNTDPDPAIYLNADPDQDWSPLHCSKIFMF